MGTQKPEIENELIAEVKGYGCDDDCKEYFTKVSVAIDNCGWLPTPKTNDHW